MKEKIKSILGDYIQGDKTDYSLMLTGEWGCGKTYFIINTLFPYIKGIKYKGNEQQPWHKKLIAFSPKSKGKNIFYNPIYVSLYGLNSIDDIYERIIFSYIPQEYRNILLSVKTGINCFGGSNEVSRQITKFIGISPNDVLFFDDLERIDQSHINIKSVLGYINFLSEHNNYKIVVIANDEVLDDDYKRFKEKSVRFSIHYDANLNDIFDSISNNYNNNGKEIYFEFIKAQKELILSIFRKCEYKNVRTLLFICDTFEKVYSKIDGKYKDEISKDLLTEFIPMSIESKKGHTKDEVISNLPFNQTSSDYEALFGDSSNTQKTNENYKKELEDKYGYVLHDLICYPELADLVYDGYISDESINSIINNIRDKYIQQEISEFQKCAMRMKKWTRIPDPEFGNVIREVKQYIIERRYQVNDLLNIYASFLQIEDMGIEGFDKISPSDVDMFKEAILFAMKDKPYIPSLDIVLLMWNDNDKSAAKDKYNEMRNYAIEINRNNQKSATKNQSNEILSMIRENKVSDFQTFISNVDNLFPEIGISPDEMAKAIISASAEMKELFHYGLTKFFPIADIVTQKIDIDWLDKFKKEMDDYVNNLKHKTPDSANMIYIQRYVNKVLNIYKQANPNNTR